MLVFSLLGMLVIAIAVFFALLPWAKKIKAPTRENSTSERIDNTGKINSNTLNGSNSSVGSENEDQNNSANTESPANQNTSIENANPDSATTIQNPQTTDYSNIQGSQFDER